MAITIGLVRLRLRVEGRAKVIAAVAATYDFQFLNLRSQVELILLLEKLFKLVAELRKYFNKLQDGCPNLTNVGS